MTHSRPMYALPAQGSNLPVHTPAPPAEDEPSKLWLLLVRYRLSLLAAALACAGLAWGAGKMFGRPQWAVEGTLLYNPMPLPEKHRGVLQLPSLTTYASWVKDPEHLERIIKDFGIAMSPDQFGERCLKVTQPPDTQVIGITLTYPYKEPGLAIVNRLMDLQIETVAAKRRDAILRQSLQSARQGLEQARSESERLDSYARQLEEMLTRGMAPEADIDVSVTIRRNTILAEMHKEQGKLDEEMVQYAADVERYKKMEGLAVKGAVSRWDVEGLALALRVRDIRIKNQEQLIASLRKEMRELPITVARTKKADHDVRAEQCRQEIAQLEQALANPKVLPAALASQGIEAREFTVRAPARCGDAPAASNRKTLALGAFLALMAAAVGLVYVYDRQRSADPVFGRWAGGPRLTRVVRVDHGRDGRPEKVTVAQVQSNRMTVRIDHWLDHPDGPPPAGHAPVTINPDGYVEEPRTPPPSNNGDSVSQLALRIHHWLERGNGTQG